MDNKAIIRNAFFIVNSPIIDLDFLRLKSVREKDVLKRLYVLVVGTAPSIKIFYVVSLDIFTSLSFLCHIK